MIIFRYLLKEVLTTLVVLTIILLLIFMSNQFMLYLNRMASGRIPSLFILKLMMLELPTLTGFLLPLGFYFSLLVAYGRLYADSEMTVLYACGYGPSQLLKHSFVMAIMLGFIVSLLVLWLNPIIAKERTKLLRTTGIQILIQTTLPGRFQQVLRDDQVYYVESMDSHHTKAENVFIARKQTKNAPNQWDILWAKRAFSEKDPSTNEDYLVLQKGSQYQGIPGNAAYKIVHFDQYKTRLPHPTITLKAKDISMLPTTQLLPFFNPNLRKASELQWRLSMPIMVLVLTLLAIPLSQVNPRSGKYMKLLPALVLFFVYANTLFVSRDWIVLGKIPLWIGVWWLHGLMAVIGLGLIYRKRVGGS